MYINISIFTVAVKFIRNIIAVISVITHGRFEDAACAGTTRIFTFCTMS